MSSVNTDLFNYVTGKSKADASNWKQLAKTYLFILTKRTTSRLVSVRWQLRKKQQQHHHLDLKE